MRATVVGLSEMVETGSWSVAEAAQRYGCHLCGLTPANVLEARRPNPRTALLEPDGVDEKDPLHRSTYRCRNREACERRQRALNG